MLVDGSYRDVLALGETRIAIQAFGTALRTVSNALKFFDFSHPQGEFFLL